MRKDFFWMQGLSKEGEDAWVELVPIDVKRDDNCLVHAANLSLYGEDDTNFELRKILHEDMVKHQKVFFSAYVQYKTKRNSASSISSFSMSSDQWKQEWAEIVEYAKPIQGILQKNLKPIHIYALANLLGRVIIVYAKQVPEVNLTSESFGFGGIYLPNLSNSLWHTNETMVNPIILAHDCGHFRLLLINSRCKEKGADKLSINDENGECMPIHFLWTYHGRSSDDVHVDYAYDENELKIGPFSSQNYKIRLLSNYLLADRHCGISFITLNLDGM